MEANNPLFGKFDEIVDAILAKSPKVEPDENNSDDSPTPAPAAPTSSPRT